MIKKSFYNFFIITKEGSVSDRLNLDFKKIFTAWKTCEVMIASRLRVMIKDIIFNRDLYVLYKLTIKSAYTQVVPYYCTLGKIIISMRFMSIISTS